MQYTKQPGLKNGVQKYHKANFNINKQSPAEVERYT